MISGTAADFRAADHLREEWRLLAAAWHTLIPGLDPASRVALTNQLWDPVSQRMIEAIEEVELAIVEARAALVSVK